MRTEVGGQIRHADSVVRARRLAFLGRGLHRPLVPDIELRALPANLEWTVNREKRKRYRRTTAVVDARDHRVARGVDALPVAQPCLDQQAHAGRIRKCWIEVENAFDIA